jgi:hypothetical protein
MRKIQPEIVLSGGIEKHFQPAGIDFPAAPDMRVEITG